jgi:putative Holliday junction resolvase
MARSLGLDVGKRRIGIATCDTLKVIARPLDVIDRKKQDALSAIITHVQTQLADEIVVGYPYHVNGTVSEQAQTVERFIDALRARVSIPIVYCDERFSTGEAREIMGAKRRKDAGQHDDAIAAAVILQRYLNKRRDESNTQREDDMLSANE